jgi:PAS domain S-box-containing protein
VKPAGAREVSASALHRNEDALEQHAREEMRALAEQNRILRQDNQGLAAELEAVHHLQQVSTLLIESHGIRLLYEKILDAATTALHADFASLQLLDPDHGTNGALELLGHRGFSAEAARFWEWVSPASRSVCATALREGQRITVPDIRNCDFMAGTSDMEMCVNTGIRAVQTTPLLSRSGVTLGMLSTHWREPHDLTAAESRFLDILARLAADLIERVQTKSALRAREEDFHLFVNNVREYALVQTDANGHVTSWNPGAERLFGYRRAEVVGKGFSELAVLDDDAAAPSVPDSGRSAPDNPPEAAGWMIRNDGDRFWARWITEPVYDENHSRRGTAWIVRDETARLLTETAIHDSLTEKNELLKDIHHRVKNNLQIIISLMNLQSGRIEDRRMLEPFDETRNRVQSIASIYELLYRSDTFAVVDAAEYSRLLVKDIVRSHRMQEQIEMEISGSGITLDLDRAVPFGLLLNELVSNVCKHAFPDGKSGKLFIALHCEDGRIVLMVTDNGTGLPADFDYFRASSLGLQLVHSLARQLRADIEIQVENGTRVIVGVPQRTKDDNA